MQLRGGGGGGLPYPFSESKKTPLVLEIKGPDFVHPEVKFTIQNIVLRVSRTKSCKIFCSGIFFPWFFEEMLIEVPLFWETTEQFLVVRLHIYNITNLILVHWICIESIYRNHGGLVVWYLKRWAEFYSQPESILSTVNCLQLMIQF